MTTDAQPELTRAEINLLKRVHVPGFTTIKFEYTGTRIRRRTDSALNKKCKELAKKGMLHRPVARWVLTDAGVKVLAAVLVAEEAERSAAETADGKVKRLFTEKTNQELGGEGP